MTLLQRYELYKQMWFLLWLMKYEEDAVFGYCIAFAALGSGINLEMLPELMEQRPLRSSTYPAYWWPTTQVGHILRMEALDAAILLAEAEINK